MNLKPIYQAEASNPAICAEAGPRHTIGVDFATGPDYTVTRLALTPLQHVLAHTERDYYELCQLIDSALFETLLKAEQGRLQRQKLIMIDYVAVLNERIAAWGVV